VLRVRIRAGDIAMTAALSESSTTAELMEILPVTGKAQRWGDEIYFSVPLEHIEEDAKGEVPSGTVAYWPPGSAIRVFFGQKPYSPVNVLGMLEGDSREFSKVAAGDEVTIEKA